MKRLFGLVLFTASWALAATVTCTDGRVIGLTPFNQYTKKEVLCGEAAAPKPVKPLVSGDFVKIFGPEPQAKDFKNYRVFQQARDLWHQDLRGFKGVGVPEGVSAEDLKGASDVFEAWGLGECFSYQGRFGWFVRCPSAEWVPGIEFPFAGVLASPHNAVASYQETAVNLGVFVPKNKRHPFVSPNVWAQIDPVEVE